MPHSIDDQRRWYVDCVFEYDGVREEWAALSHAAVLSGTRRKLPAVHVHDFVGRLLCSGTFDGGARGGPGGRCVALCVGVQVVVVRFPSTSMCHSFVRWIDER